MSVMGFQKKVWMGVGGALSKFILDFCTFLNFAKPLSEKSPLFLFIVVKRGGAWTKRVFFCYEFANL